MARTPCQRPADLANRITGGQKPLIGCDTPTGPRLCPKDQPQHGRMPSRGEWLLNLAIARSLSRFRIGSAPHTAAFRFAHFSVRMFRYARSSAESDFSLDSAGPPLFHPAVSGKGLFFKYWLPVILWMGLIFCGSTDVLSSQRTSRFIGPFLRWLNPNISEETISAVQTVVRKGGHVTEYSVLAALIWRARRKPFKHDPRPWSWNEAARVVFIPGFTRPAMSFINGSSPRAALRSGMRFWTCSPPPPASCCFGIWDARAGCGKLP